MAGKHGATSKTLQEVAYNLLCDGRGAQYSTTEDTRMPNIAK